MVKYKVIEHERDKTRDFKDRSVSVLGTYFNKQEAYKRYNEVVDQEKYLQYRRNDDVIPSPYGIYSDTYTYYEIVKYTSRGSYIIKESERF